MPLCLRALHFLLKRFFSTTSPTIASAAFLIFLSGLGSRFLGLLRDRILADHYGASRSLDIYYAAFRIPDFMYTLLVVGALSSAFIPVFVAHLAKSRKDAERLAANTVNVLLVFLGLVSVLGIIVAPLLIPLIAPGFSPGEAALTVQLTRIMFLSPVLLGISNVASGILQSFRVYAAFALAPMFYNIGIIIGATMLTGLFGLAGLAWGVVLGAALHLAIQLPSIRHIGFRWQKILRLGEKGLGEIMRLALPRLVGLGASQINLWVLTALASTLSAGTIAIFNFSNNLQAFPVGIIALSFATAVFPVLSEKWAKGRVAEFAEIFEKTCREIFFLVAPLSALFWLLRAQIVRAVLGSGAFGWEDTRLTAGALAVFSVSIFAQGLILLLVRAFYARHNTKTPVFYSIFAVVANVILAFLFVRAFDEGGFFREPFTRLLRLEGIADIRIIGLAFSYTVAHILQLLLLFLRLRRELRAAFTARLWRSLRYTAVLTLAMVPFVFLALRLFAALIPLTTFFGVLAQGIGAGLVGAFSYLGLAYLANMEELGLVRDLVGRRLFHARTVVSEIHGPMNGKE